MRVEVVKKGQPLVEDQAVTGHAAAALALGEVVSTRPEHRVEVLPIVDNPVRAVQCVNTRPVADRPPFRALSVLQ